MLTLSAASKKTLGIIRCSGTPWHKEIGLDVTTRSCQVVCENEDGENNEKRQGLVTCDYLHRLPFRAYFNFANFVNPAAFRVN